MDLAPRIPATRTGSWTRGRRHVLGFGPFPIVFSINLFLWFRDDWFYLQFLSLVLIATGTTDLTWGADIASTRSVDVPSVADTGKAVFGCLYGTGVFAPYAILGTAGAPTF